MVVRLHAARKIPEAWTHAVVWSLSFPIEKCVVSPLMLCNGPCALRLSSGAH